MKHFIKFITLGIIVLLCLADCDTIEEGYDIRGDWDVIVSDSIDGSTTNAISTFQGTKENGYVYNNQQPGDPYYEEDPASYIVSGNHVVIWRSQSCPTCGNHLEGDFEGANNVSGTWYDYRIPPHNGIWAMTRR